MSSKRRKYPRRLRPFPPVHIPMCLLRFNRSFEGTIGSDLVTTYTCDASSEATSRFKTRIDWIISGGKDCDEIANILPASQLEGTGETIFRPNGFAYSVSNFGECFIKDLGQPDRKLFDCSVELISLIGSHQFLGENCNQQEHIEGWLFGAGLGDFQKYRLTLVIVCKASLPNGSALDVRTNRMTGVLMFAKE